MVCLILHNIRSVYNVASIFRTAECAGVSQIYLTGITPTPTDRFGRARKDFAKVSLGAEKTVPFEYRANVTALVRRLQKEKVLCIAVEQAKNSVDYRRVRVRKHTAYLLGNEVSGVPPFLLRHCDVVVEIPMRGSKESLNVAVAVGVILFQML